MKYRRQATSCRQFCEPFYVRSEQRVWRDDKSASAGPGRVSKRFVEIMGVSYLQRMQLESQLSCWELDFLPSKGGTGTCVLWVPEHGYPREHGKHLLEQLQSFSRQLGGDLGQPRNVAAGLRKALNKPTCDRITRRRHHNRDCLGRAFGCESVRRNGSHDNINVQADEIDREVREYVGSLLRISVLNADVLSLDPSEVAETLPERLVPKRGSGRREWR